MSGLARAGIVNFVNTDKVNTNKTSIFQTLHLLAVAYHVITCNSRTSGIGIHLQEVLEWC